jgi:acetyl esterase/lipase
MTPWETGLDLLLRQLVEPLAILMRVWSQEGKLVVDLSLFVKLSIVLLFILPLTGCGAAPAPLTGAVRPSWLPASVSTEQNIQYVPGGDPAQKLDVYWPAQAASKPMPLVIWIHGGGWEGGDKTWCNSLYLVAHGYAAASVEYRFSQTALFPAQIQDCQAAIRWLRANSKKYNIDPKEIGVWGESAGGHLVSLLGTSGGKHAFPLIGGNEDQSDRVQAVVDSYGPSDFNSVVAQAAADPTKNIFDFNHGDPYSKLIGIPLGSDIEKGNAVSPVHYVSRDNPPFLILHGTHDNLVPFAQSLELQAALEKAKVPVLLQPFPNAGHGGDIFGKNPDVEELIKQFFDKYLLKQNVNLQLLPDNVVTVK